MLFGVPMFGRKPPEAPTDWEATKHRITVEVRLEIIQNDLFRIRQKLGIQPEPGTTVMRVPVEDFQKKVENP